MGYCRFLENLLEDGRVVVPQFRVLPESEIRKGSEILIRFEHEYRAELPGSLPPFDLASGCWAAIRLFRASQFAVYRDVPAHVVDHELALPVELPVAPATHYSVDVLFRFLPDLVKFAASASEGAPLVQHLMGWARQWPLSSVGVSDVGEIRLDGFAGSDGLLQLYADRIIATGDTSRLSDPRACEAVRASLGMYPNLAPRIAEALQDFDQANDPPPATEDLVDV